MKLLTNGQQFAQRKRGSIYFDREIVINSELFWAMPKVAIRVYMIFRSKCVVQKIKARSGMSDAWMISNNGEIQFSYKEAKDKFGIHHSAFTRAIDSLVKSGFIDLEHQGQGTKGDNSMYAISDRWKNYGTESFVAEARAKRLHGYGKDNRFKASIVEDYISYPTKQVKTIPFLNQNSRVRAGMIPP